MVQISTLLAVAGCLLSSSSVFISGSPLVPTERDIAAYTLVDGPIQWRGTLEEGKEMVYLTGDSFEDIEAQAKALNPTYTIFNNSTALKARDGLNTRQLESVHCGWPPGWTPTWDFLALDAGIKYLRGISGDCHSPPGPATCGRVSCSWGSAIYWCNDNRHDIWQRCSSLGDAAATLVSRCRDYGGNGRTLGQYFDVRKWNVIVASGDC